MTRQKKLGITFFLVGLAFIATMTLIPEPGQVGLVSETSFFCLLCGDLGTVDVFLNLILFLPVGLGLGLLGRKWSGLATIVSLTLVIELFQMKVIVGRDASLSDLLTNTAGGILGMVLARRWRGLVFPGPAASRRIAQVAAAGWITLQAFSAWAVQPALPQSHYWGQWAPDLEHLEQFTGSVQSAFLDSLPIGNGELAGSEAVRRRLLSGGGSLRVRAIAGSVTVGLAPIVSSFDQFQREIFILGQDRLAAVFQLRTHLHALRLRGPAISLPGAMPTAAGATLLFDAGYAHGRLHLNMEISDTSALPPGTRLSREVVLSPSWGWSFVLPYTYYFGWKAPYLTMLWIGGLLLPIGYWASRARRSGAGRIPPWLLLLITAALGLGGAALLFHIPIPGLTEWLAAGLGSVGGIVLGKRTMGGWADGRMGG